MATKWKDLTLARFPNTHGNQLVFEAHDNLWVANLAGGQATALTSGLAHDLMPRFSLDGQWVAFTRRSRGAEDVFVVSSKGGEPKRLTFRSNRPGGPGPTFIAEDNLVATWTPDSRNVVFLSRSMSFNWSDLRLFQVSIEGGLATPLPLGHAGLMTFGPNGHSVAFTRNFSDLQTRKRYDGGLAPDIYTYDFATKRTKQITSWKGTDTAPMWSGRKIYFLSDRDTNRRANIWVYDLDSKTCREVTHFTDYDIDMPSLGDGTISFQQGGKLYALTINTGVVRELHVLVPDDSAHTKTRDVNVSDLIRDSDASGSDFALSPNGDRIVLSARGDLFQLRPATGTFKNLTQTSNADEDHPAFSPDGKTLAYTSDVSGEQEIVLRSEGDSTERTVTHLISGYLYRPMWSPDGGSVVISNSERELWLVPVTGGEPRRIARDPTGLIRDSAFTPDGRWLAFSTGRLTQQRCLHLYEIASGIDTVVSSPMNSDFSPAFSSDGSWLFFISSRHELSVMSENETNFATVKTSGLYAVALTVDVASPFTAYGVGPHAEVHLPSPTLKGLMDRIVPIPIATSDLTSLEVRGGSLFYQTVSAATYGGDLPNDNGALHIFDLASKLDRVVNDGVSSHQISQDGSKVIYQRNGDWYVSDTAAGQLHETKLDVDALRAQVDPRQEWKEMFDNAWRLERDLFFDKTMGGNDWKAIHHSYAKLIPMLGSRDDLNYLIGAMQGELASSHMFVFGGDDLAPVAQRASVLGVDYRLDASKGLYRFAKIYRGDNSRPDYRSPLAEPGMNVNEGDYLLSINGVDLKEPSNPYSAMVGAGSSVILEVASTSDTPRRKITVQPLRSEFHVREQDRIDSNRRSVDRLSSGKIGYLYVSDFDDLGALQFMRQFYAQTGKEALIIDERWNGGGSTSQWVLERLRRSVSGGLVNRSGAIQTLPDALLSGPKVALINEFSASDGDQFAYFFQKDGLGKLIGKRTWGGVRGMGNDPGLLDGGHVTVPHDALFGADGKWLIENYGVNPDVSVDETIGATTPEDDAQLQSAVSVLLQELSRPKTQLSAPKPPAYPLQGLIPIDKQ
jgi:tricorn protease